MTPVQQREQLPTAAEIERMTDLGELGTLRDRIAKACADIEVELDFSDRDEQWAHRARKALSVHMFTGRVVDRRIGSLQRQTLHRGAPGRRRPERENSALTMEVLVKRPKLDLSVKTIEALDAHLAWLSARIDAVSADRSSELSQPADRRDTIFISQASTAIRWLNLVSNDVRALRGAAAREARRNVAKPIERKRERLFIDIAREQLDPAVYSGIWARVDQIQPHAVVIHEVVHNPLSGAPSKVKVVVDREGDEATAEMLERWQ